MVRVAGHVVPVFVGDLEILPPRVVHILRDKCSRRVADAHNIPLQVFVVPVFRSVALHPDDRAVRIVHIVDRMRVCSRPPLRQYFRPVGRVRHNVRRSVCDMLDVLLRGADAVCVILHPQRLVRAACRGVGQRNFRQSVSCPVQIRCVFPVFRVPRSVIGDRCAVVVCQQVAPTGRTVCIRRLVYTAIRITSH